MKKWNYKVKSTPQGIVNKLNAAFRTADGFVFNMEHDKNDLIVFDFHKPVRYPDQILHRNRIMVNGRILKTDTENESNIEFYFNQHLFMILTVFSIVFSGLVLIAIILTRSTNVSMYLLGGVLIAVGIVLWLALQKKFEKDIQQYKTLISGILEA